MAFRSQIPIAEPYQWDEEEGGDGGVASGGSQGNAAAGTGLARLHKLARDGRHYIVSDEARTILSHLLKIPMAGSCGASTAIEDRRGTISEDPLDLLSYDIPTSDLIHSGSQSIIDLAKEGKLSLFSSILRLFRDGEELSTPNIIRACSHAIRPADVPPDMDAKEMVMAALHFLSSSVPELNVAVVGPYCNGESLVGEMFPYMPIILSSNIDENLDRRSYTKNTQTPNGTWSIEDATFHQKVIRLEKAFLASSVSNPSRLRMCPRVDDNDAEAKLLASGTLPAASKAKGAGGATRKK